MSDEKSLVRITFPLDPNAWHRSATETIWATPLGSDAYLLENSPFFAFGVSYKDVVLARRDATGSLAFVQALRRGGHSTYRLIVTQAHISEFPQYWQPVAALGCTYEEGMKNLKAVDVPPEADVFKVYKLFEIGERSGVWDFEEGHCAKVIA